MSLASRIKEELQRHTVCTLATVDGAGPEPLAHAASVMYAHEGFTLYWVSDPKSRHSMHIAAQPRISVTIDRQFDDFNEIVGLQLSGRAALISDKSEKDAAHELLAARYPFLEQFRSGPKALVLRFAAIEVYRFESDTITLIENAKGFGHKETLEVT